MAVLSRGTPCALPSSCTCVVGGGGGGGGGGEHVRCRLKGWCCLRLPPHVRRGASDAWIPMRGRGRLVRVPAAAAAAAEPATSTTRGHRRRRRWLIDRIVRVVWRVCLVRGRVVTEVGWGGGWGGVGWSGMQRSGVGWLGWLGGGSDGGNRTPPPLPPPHLPERRREEGWRWLGLVVFGWHLVGLDLGRRCGGRRSDSCHLGVQGRHILAGDTLRASSEPAIVRGQIQVIVPRRRQRKQHLGGGGGGGGGGEGLDDGDDDDDDDGDDDNDGSGRSCDELKRP